MELNGKTVYGVEIDGVDHRDAPDFCDAFFSYAEYEDGMELTDDELDELKDKNGDKLYEMIWEGMY